MPYECLDCLDHKVGRHVYIVGRWAGWWGQLKCLMGHKYLGCKYYWCIVMLTQGTRSPSCLGADKRLKFLIWFSFRDLDDSHDRFGQFDIPLVDAFPRCTSSFTKPNGVDAFGVFRDRMAFEAICQHCTVAEITRSWKLVYLNLAFFRWGRSDLAVVELAHGVVEHLFYKLGAPLRPIALAEQPPSRMVLLSRSEFLIWWVSFTETLAFKRGWEPV